jgi:transglutaminase-like putative cysteine protease
MKLTQFSILLFVTTFFSNLNAQNFELGKVSVAELQEKSHPKDTSAVAAILFKKGKTSYDYSKSNGFIMTTEVQTRIKIYKKEGYDWANQKVNYYLGNSSKENVAFSDAITYNLVGGKIEKTKLSKEGEFDEVVNRYWGQKKISMPNVREGSVIEFQYIIKTPYVGSPKDWSFQAGIPVNYSEYRSFIPEYYTFNTNYKGFIFPKVTTEKKAKSVLFSTMERDESAGLMRVQTSSYSQSKFSYEETRTTYIAENLPAMIEEAYVNNIENYTSCLSQELSMVKYPNESLKSLSTNWESVTKTIYEFDDFGLELNKTDYFEDNIDKIINSLDSEEEKIAAIFNHVKSSVRWNEYYGYSCNDGVKKAYKDKIGNVAEINLMLTAMLRYAGLTANPVLLSTRSNGIALYPNRTAFNYVIAAVEVPNGLILLDATEIYSMPNVLPLRDLNWSGRLIRKDGTSTQVDLTPKSISKAVVNMNLVLKNDGSADGKIRLQFSNHEALEFRQKNLATNKDAYLEELENKNNGVEISDYARENDMNLSKPIVETYSFKDTKDLEIINDKIYLDPMLFMSTKENFFKQEVREYPVDFGYPVQNKYNIGIEIPEGYVVESMPEPLNIITGDNGCVFKYLIENLNNKIQVVITAEINTVILSSDFYVLLKEFYQKMIDKQNEKIVLKKV